MIMRPPKSQKEYQKDVTVRNLNVKRNTAIATKSERFVRRTAHALGAKTST